MPHSSFRETTQNKMPPIPTFIYGTAWKEQRTEELTFEALQAGFRAIDTANQRKHYFEEGAGKGIARFLEQDPSSREDLFIQTKFTFANGQDHRMPYDESLTFSEQVRQSFDSSCHHLQTSYLDSYVLHGPYQGRGLTSIDWETWGAMESLYKENKVRSLGVSNVNLEQLKELHQKAEIKPSFLQDRCFAALGWNQEMRHFCEKNGIHYQGFSLLTANPRELRKPLFENLSQRYKKTVAQIVFQFCNQMKIIPITGTTSRTHMQEDLNSFDFELSKEEITQIESCALDA